MNVAACPQNGISPWYHSAYVHSRSKTKTCAGHLNKFTPYFCFLVSISWYHGGKKVGLSRYKRNISNNCSPRQRKVYHRKPGCIANIDRSYEGLIELGLTFGFIPTRKGFTGKQFLAHSIFFVADLYFWFTRKPSCRHFPLAAPLAAQRERTPAARFWRWYLRQVF